MNETMEEEEVGGAVNFFFFSLVIFCLLRRVWTANLESV